jgi:hypothetical protein
MAGHVNRQDDYFKGSSLAEDKLVGQVGHSSHSKMIALGL